MPIHCVGLTTALILVVQRSMITLTKKTRLKVHTVEQLQEALGTKISTESKSTGFQALSSSGFASLSSSGFASLSSSGFASL